MPLLILHVINLSQRCGPRLVISLSISFQVCASQNSRQTSSRARIPLPLGSKRTDPRSGAAHATNAPPKQGRTAGAPRLSYVQIASSLCEVVRAAVS